MTSKQLLACKIFLRIFGTSCLFALFAVIMPYGCMNAIHGWLGLGTLPDAPVVGYLARSTSAFYALLGGLIWTLSFDLPRYRAVLTYLGAAIACFGAALTIIDWQEGLPLFWSLLEGPLDTALGLVMLWFARRIPK